MAFPYVPNNNKKKKTGNQWWSIVRQAANPTEEPSTVAFHDNPSPVFMHGMTGSLSCAQRALRFNLSVSERAAFVQAKSRVSLFPHQEEGVQFMRQNEQPGSLGGIYWLPPRTGKTKMFMSGVYRAIQESVARGEPRFGMPTLLLVPKNVIDTMAFENQELFAENCELLTKIILSDSVLGSSDVHSIIASHDLVITSYSTLITFHQKWVKSYGLCTDTGPQLMFKTKWRRVIADEGHRFANNKNLVFDAVTALNAHHRWYVTATPIQNAMSDILSALRFLHVDESYLKIECVPLLLSTLLFRRDYDDLIKINPRFAQLKPPPRETMQVSLDFVTESERLFYAYIHEQSFLHLSHPSQYENGSKEIYTKEIRPENMALRLRQACLSPWLLPEGFIMPEGMRYSSEEMDGRLWYLWVYSKLMGTEPDPLLVQAAWPTKNILPPISTKELVLLDYIRIEVEPKGEKIVIFSEWMGALARLQTLLEWRAYIRQGHMRHKPEDGVVQINGTVKAHVRRQGLQDMWTNPKKYIMLVTLQSGGLGEDFTFANHGILIDPWWTPATEFQALMRLFGMKQTRQIRIMVLCMSNSVEDHVQKRANEKRGYESIMTAKPVTNEEGLLLDPNEEPAFFDPKWFTAYMQKNPEEVEEVDDMDIDGLLDEVDIHLMDYLPQ